MRRRQRPPEPPDPVRSRISEAHRRFVQAVVFVHFGSLVACAAAGLQARESGGGTAAPPDAPTQHSHRPTLPWMARHGAPSGSDPQAPNMSYFWQEDESPEDICRLSGTSRIAHLNSTFLFHERHPISVWEVFSGSSSTRESRLRLRDGVQGYDCVYGSQYDCLRCFSRVRASLRRLEAAFGVFNATLHRFDCMPAVDTASATRPFSPNGSCEHCKTWYGRWLLVHLLEVWEQPPCINWCYYAQLACPHLATSKVVDYAGHPSFQCRDLHIPIGDSDVYSCNCVHPCDVRGAVTLKSGSGSGSTSGNDFFAAKHHCATRRKHCASTAHDRARTGVIRSGRGERLAVPLALLISVLVAAGGVR